MMDRTLSILAPTRYPWRFNSPRASRHDIAVRNFIPFNKLSRSVEGLTVFNPLPLRKFDLVHAFNRIPLGPTPFVVGFESHLPRAFGMESSALFRFSAGLLAGRKCRRIIAISDYAKRQFLVQHYGKPWYEALKHKIETRYPNLDIPAELPVFQPAPDGRIRLLFVGNHFARKGGCVALRIAELANERDIPVQVEIVSSFEVGSASWVDPTRASFHDAYRALLTALPNVTHHAALPNGEVLKLVKQAHFMLLPTFSDSFGYSAIEAMAHGTPVIATAQCALPEFINPANGIMLPLETDGQGEWIHLGRADRDGEAYETLFRDEVDRLARAALDNIEAVAGSTAYPAMRMRAHETARALFDAADASRYWDNLYDEAVP